MKTAAEVNWDYLIISYVRCSSVSVFTVLFGLFRILRVNRVGAFTILGVPVLAWRPSPVEETF